MAKVDYERVAETYDELAIRREVPKDQVIGELVARTVRPVRVLDVGCGTGAYLLAQAKAFGAAVELTGMDPSEGMLARARAKLPDSKLLLGSAESLPFPDAAFDFVATRFTFHHFEDKPRALREMRRVLAPGGTLFLTNIAPERMPGWWVFRLFPEAAADNERYWPAERLASELTTLGFEVTWEAPPTLSTVPLAEALTEARKRDQSHLYVMDDAAYTRRLKELKLLLETDPTGSIPSEVTVLKTLARRARS